jgi:hypothetical protein
MAVDGKYLFGADYNLSTSSITIDSFSIAANGALSQVTSTSAANSGDGLGVLFLDHTGSSLYSARYESQFGSDVYQTFAVDNTTGALSYRGETAASTEFGWRMSFIANNQYVYGANCNGDRTFAPDIFGFKRSPDQTLGQLNIQPKIPQPPKGKLFYCPFLAAADTSNHVAISMDPIGSTTTGPIQLATYSANKSGGLTTTSTAGNMPRVTVGWVNTMWMSPSGKLLAVGGMNGLQVFHFNGANPIKPYTWLLTKDEIDQVFLG